jgi:hypothetical protein
MHIQLLHSADGRSYVQLDHIQVPFRDQRQALEYMERLKQRLAAPHVLVEAQRSDSGKSRDAEDQCEAG